MDQQALMTAAETTWIPCTFAEAVASGIEKCQYRLSSGYLWSNAPPTMTLDTAIRHQWRRPATEAERRQQLKSMLIKDELECYATCDDGPGDGYRWLEKGETLCPGDQARTRVGWLEWTCEEHAAVVTGEGHNFRRRIDADCAGREVDLAAADTGDDWRELNGLRIDQYGNIFPVRNQSLSDDLNGFIREVHPEKSILHVDKLNSSGIDAAHELIRRWQSRQKPRLPTVDLSKLRGHVWEERDGKVYLKDNVTGAYYQLDPTLWESQLRRRALVAAFDELHGVVTVEFEADVEADPSGFRLRTEAPSPVSTSGHYTVTMRRESEAK